MKNFKRLAGMKKAVTFATAVFCMVGTFAGTTSVFAADDTQSAVVAPADTTQAASTQTSDAITTQTASSAAREVPHYDSTKDGGTWDGATYHLADGSLATQCFFTDGTYTYYLQNDGTAMKDRLTYHPDGEHLIYFDSNGHEVFDNFQFCKDVGYTCYFNTYGYAYFDQITFKGDKAYYLDKTGKMQQNGWFQFGNGVDYGWANSDGTLIINQFGTDPWGRQVFYHWNGMVARGLITDGAWYYNMDTTDGHYLGQFSVESVQKADASSHLKYVYYADKTATVVGLDDDLSSTTQNFTLNIPQTISHDGVTYTVTAIGNYAFSKWNTATFKDDKNPENVYLTKVTLPDTITLIQQYAFQGCTNLQEINLPSHLTEIGDNAFQGCTNLQEINLPSYLTKIGDNAFESCSSLTQVVFPSTLTTIGDDAFKSDSSLSKVTLNEGLTTIGSNVFDSTALTSIKIPSTWTSIPGGMFCNTKLASVNIPDSITEIGGGAFENTQLKSVIIPSHVTELGGLAFAKTPIESITIPDSVTKVGINLFQDCKNLTSVTWGKGLTSLPSNMFEGCTTMTTLDVPEGISSLDCFVFKGMTSLKTVTLPDSLTYIAPYDFQGDTSLDKVTVGSGVGLIYEKAFDGVTSLAKLDIRNSTHGIDYIPLSIVDNAHDKTSVDASSVKDANGNILLKSVYKAGYAGSYFNAYELKFTK